jgi:hypothetical protein
MSRPTDRDPFRVPTPAMISFSGGRTSAYMLYRILDAYGGALPSDVVVVFANTGKEREETLRFVDECSRRWSVPIVWVEYRDHAPNYAVVNFDTASRNGEPFQALIARRGFVPNAAHRFCSTELKVRPMKTYCLHALGWARWHNIVGLRADEGWRVAKAIARNIENKERFKIVAPLFNAGVTARTHVIPFWLGTGTPASPPAVLPQGFDLGLRSEEGNCDLCFLKGRQKLGRLIRARPRSADWWIAMERQCGTTFNRSVSVEDIARMALAQDDLFDRQDDPDDERAEECDIACGADDA